jgi:hypothetical protein
VARLPSTIARPPIKERFMTGNPAFEDFQKFNKQQLEAFTASTTLLSKGMQEIASESTEYSKKAFAANSAVIEKLLGAKTVESALAIQSEFAKSSYEGFVAQATKMTDLFTRLATEAFRPVGSALSVAQAK